MEKIDNLRAYLTAANPELARNPDALRIFIDQGRVVARATPAKGFEYRFRCNLIVMDYAGSEDAIFFPLVEWMRTYEPAQLQNLSQGEDAISFEADIIDIECADISIEVELTQAVDVLAREDGSGFDLVHRVELPLIGTEPLENMEEAPPLSNIWVDGALMVGSPTGG